MRNKLRLKSKLIGEKKIIIINLIQQKKRQIFFLSIHLITLMNMLIPYLWTKSGIMLQQTNINLIDFSFLRFFMKIFLEIGISILEVANAS